MITHDLPSCSLQSNIYTICIRFGASTPILIDSRTISHYPEVHLDPPRGLFLFRPHSQEITQFLYVAVVYCGNSRYVLRRVYSDTVNKPLPPVKGSQFDQSNRYTKVRQLSPVITLMGLIHQLPVNMLLVARITPYSASQAFCPTSTPAFI